MSQPGSVIPVNLPTAPPAPRAAFGWPPGSIRALMVLMVAAQICAHLLIPSLQYVPGYLIYLILLMVGHYFAARSHARPDYVGPQPLFLPRGSVRLLVFAGLVGTIGYKLATDPTGLEAIFARSVEKMQKQPELPLVLLSAFFLGVFFRVGIFRGKPPALWQDLEAWLALIAVVCLGTAALLHLVIDPSVGEKLNLPRVFESILTGIIAFYFGDR